MAAKSLHQFFYYHNKYLNSMKCQEISMGPSIRTIQCRCPRAERVTFGCGYLSCSNFDSNFDGISLFHT
jgi:hypothetical protein